MSRWAWLGDMELDDTLLGLGAAGIFSASEPLAVGFLVNAAHCAERSSEGDLRVSEMYREKRSFLSAFFGGRFYAVLDRYAAAGKGRGWAGALTDQQLAGLGGACGLEDELAGWLEAVERGRPRALHLLLSGPLLGRGEELCSALATRVLAPADAGAGPEAAPAPRLFLWTYAGSFNLSHSSEEDRASIRKLVDDHAPRVSVVETTLKAGAWICDPPQTFWAASCPVAWSEAEAKQNPIGFDVSTDIQSVNMFLQEYSSRGANGEAKLGLQSIFQQIINDGSVLGLQSQADSISSLIRELEVRSLATNLTKMVPPDSASMAKLREALGLQQEQLEAAYRTAVGCLEELQADLKDGRTCTCQRLTLAAQEYAELYQGPSGTFLESGTTESFPPEKPFSGPRLDKRCILRCMSEGKLQGGPTADLLIVLALLLFLEDLDAAADITEGQGQMTDSSVSMSLVCTASSEPEPAKRGCVCRRLPSNTRGLFHLHPARGSTQVFSAVLRPDVEMNGTTRTALAPLVDLAIEALILGGIRLQKVQSKAGWGRLHGPLQVATKGG